MTRPLTVSARGPRARGSLWSRPISNRRASVHGRGPGWPPVDVLPDARGCRPRGMGRDFHHLGLVATRPGGPGGVYFFSRAHTSPDAADGFDQREAVGRGRSWSARLPVHRAVCEARPLIGIAALRPGADIDQPTTRGPSDGPLPSAAARSMTPGASHTITDPSDKCV
jgi:hypothetical protein